MTRGAGRRRDGDRLHRDPRSSRVLAFAGLVLDAGLAISTKVQAVSDAQSAARAGARELDVAALRTNGVIRLDPAQAQAAARSWLTRAGLAGTVTVTPDTVTVTVTTVPPHPTAAAASALRVHPGHRDRHRRGRPTLTPADAWTGESAGGRTKR